MLKASQIRGALFVLLLAFVHVSCTAQDRRVGVGADGLLWASGWSHAQISFCVTEELQVQCGAGALRSSASPVSVWLRPRPGAFDRAGLFTLGVRANPGYESGRPLRAVIGMEWATETYVKSAVAEWGTFGTMKWSRRDLRLLAGAEWLRPSGLGVSVLVGLGHSGTAGEGFDVDLTRRVENGPDVTRMFGAELTKWF